MAKVVGQNAVSVLPPTISIKDPPTRSFLDALTNVLDARSGYTDKDSPERFITAAEFQGLTKRALVQAFSGGGALGSGSADWKVPSALEVNDTIDNLSDFIRKSLAHQILGEQFGLIDISKLRQSVQELGTGIYREETTRKEADLLLVSVIETVQAAVETAKASVTSESEVRASRDLAIAKAVNTIWAAVGGSEAVIQDGALASATPNTAQATKWDHVQSAVRDPNTGQTASSSILQETRTYASNADSKFNSIYSVRAQVSVGGQTLVGGFGLTATAGASSGQGPTIDFGVRADKFFIAATSATPDAQTQINQGSSIPFMVLTSSQWVNGVVYGPGVYIKKAVIGDATIGNAQIADAAITTAKIGVAQVDTLSVRGNSITGMAFADGAGGTLPPAGTASVAAVNIAMPAGASGVVVSATINIIGLGNSSIAIYISRDGVHLKSISVSVRDGWYSTYSLTAFDPSPVDGVNTYLMTIHNPPYGPGSNTGVAYNSPSLVASGGKR